MEGKISVIILVHGDEKELNRCVDRILNQNYENYELIVVSTQKNSELEEKANNTDLMTLYIKDVDKLEDLRAYALNKANGNIFYVKSKYLFLSNTITDLRKVMIENQVDVVTAGEKEFNADKRVFYRIQRDDKVVDISDRKEVEVSSLNGCLIKKEIFDGIDDLNLEDNKLVNRILEKANKVMLKNSDYLIKLID